MLKKLVGLVNLIIDGQRDGAGQTRCYYIDCNYGLLLYVYSYMLRIMHQHYTRMSVNWIGKICDNVITHNGTITRAWMLERGYADECN